jgi:hypothetical protein
MRAITLDPSVFRCAGLAGELADEWAEHAEITGITSSSAGLGRRAIRDFCTRVDSVLGEQAAGAGLGKHHPNLAAVLVEWERTLPKRFRAGATTPSTLAAMVRALVPGAVDRGIIRRVRICRVTSKIPPPVTWTRVATYRACVIRGRAAATEEHGPH